MDTYVDPIECLLREHDEGMKHLAILENAADYIKTHGFSVEAFNQIGESIRFIDAEIRRHNEKEEQYLFPLLERHLNGPSKVMRNEHRLLWGEFNRLQTCVHDIEEGRVRGSSITELIQLSKTIVDLLRNHIEKENKVLFPMAKQVLTDGEYETLREEMSKATASVA